MEYLNIYLNKVHVYNKKYKIGGEKRWPTRKSDSILALSIIFYYSNVQTLLDERGFSEIFRRTVKNWTFKDLVLSLIVFEFENKSLTYLDWSFLTCLLLNSKVSNDFFSFIRKNKFYEVLGKEKVIKGCTFALRNYTFFYLNEKSFRNLLNFLKIDYFQSNTLLFQSLKQKNGKAILKFLNNSDNHRLILKMKFSKVDRSLKIVQKNKQLNCLFLTSMKFCLIYFTAQLRLPYKTYRSLSLTNLSTKPAKVLSSNAWRSKYITKAPIASLSEIWQIAVFDSITSASSSSDKIYVGNLSIPHKRFSVHRPAGLLKSSLVLTETASQTPSYIHKTLSLGRGQSTPIIANGVDWVEVFQQADLEQMQNDYCQGINKFTISGPVGTDEDLSADFSQLENKEKINKLVMWLGEKDFFYVENVFLPTGRVEQIGHLSTFREYDNIVVQHNKQTDKITLGTTVANQITFENIKKVVNTRLNVFLELHPVAFHWMRLLVKILGM